jgi:predicted nucleic acid-binding protein
MSDKYFLDTNIFIYTFDSRYKAKQRIATELIKSSITSQNGVISYQVVQEFVNVATRKFSQPLSYQDCSQYFKQILNPLCEIYASPILFENAFEVAERWQYSYYDSLIISASLSAGCSVLYSEDLHHGQEIQSLKIVDPFQN